MHALISGQTGTALVFDGPAIQSVRLYGAEVRVAVCRPIKGSQVGDIVVVALAFPSGRELRQ